MTILERTQIALFAAYDLRNAMTSYDMNRPTENETMGDCISSVIEFLEHTEMYLIDKNKLKGRDY